MAGVTVGRITATATIVTGDCYYNGAFLHDLIGDAQLTLYKGTAATAANVIDILACSDEQQADRSWVGQEGIYCKGGIHAVLNNGDDAALYYTRSGSGS